ncbi:hypothetical protein R1sor_023429 [Riccia sorocarpa]|uniref:Uncharacterized protein n=1 Tax=Riccia sorocarpa TaxID=122646 RepID=A0ABD3GMQ9_9MARC
MAEQSGSTDPNDAIHEVIEEIPSSTPVASGKEAETTEVTSTSDELAAVEITPKSPAVNLTLAIQKPGRGSQLKKVTTPAVAAPSPPTTRSAAGKKKAEQEKKRGKGNPPPLGSLPEAEAQAESNEGQTEPRRSLWPGEMASISAPKDDGGRESGAFSNIIHTYTMKFENNKPTPKIPLCRLVQFTRVLSTPLIEYKEMIGSDVYEEFERARQKSPSKIAWYHENMTSSAAAYILSFGEVSAAKDAQLVAEEEARKQGKPLSSKQKKDMWDARVKEICASWSSQVFKYATVVNPSLGPEFLATVRELHNSLARVEKSKLEVAHSVGLDRVKAFAAAGIHNNLKIELLKVHYSNEKTREKYHHPAKFDVDNDLRPWLQQWALWSSLELLSCDIVRKIGIVRSPKEEDEEEKTARLEADVDKFRAYFEDIRDRFWTTIWYPIEDRQDVHLNIKRAKRLVFRYYVWHLQSEKAHACFLLWRNPAHKYSMYNSQDPLCRGLLTLSDWELKNSPWWVDQTCDDENVVCVVDAEQVCFDKIMKEEERFNVSHDRFESGEEEDVIAQAELVEPSSKVDGLVLDTSRTKKQKEARQSSKADEEEDTGGNTPTGKAKEQRNPGSEPETETLVAEVDPIVPEAGTSSPAVEEEATGHDKSVQKEDARSKKRSKKQANLQLLYEGCFREDVYFPMKNKCVIVKSSLKETHDLLHGNKAKTIKDPVPIVEELKKMCAALESKRAGGYLMNNKQVPTVADCLYLDLPTGLKIDEDDTVPTWNIFPGEDDLPRKLMGLGRIILDDRGCLIILHQGTLRSAQQIADALDTYTGIWKQVTTYDEHRNYKIYHSKVEVFCKASHNFIIPKLDMPPFDLENSGRECSFISNYNQISTSKLDDGGRRKCTGFVQTLLENFTAQGDIVIDFVGEWGATLQAANNCGRCCIVAETRKNAFDSLQRVLGSLHQPAKANPEPSAAPQKSLGKKPLGDDDDLDDIFGDRETQSAEQDVEPERRPIGGFSYGGFLNRSNYQDSLIFSPEQSYRLPEYAEKRAGFLAQFTSTAGDTPGSSLDRSPKRHPFVLDEASDDDEGIVSLESDGEPFDTSH